MRGGAGHRGAAPPFPPPRSRALPVAAVLTALAAGCAGATALSETDLLTQGPVVTGIPPGAAEAAPWRRSTAAEASDAVGRAEALLGAGDAAGALEVIRAALGASPPPEQGLRLRELRVRARRLLVKTALVTATLVAEPPRITEGATLSLRVGLRNLSPVPLVVHPPAGGVSPTLLRLVVTRTSHDVYGNRLAESWEESHAVPEGTVAPGATREWTVPFDTGRFRGRFPRGFVEYGFGGTILPALLTVGEVQVHERIAVEDGLAWSFPERWEEVAADPAGAVERGLRVANPVRVLVAARCAEGPGAAALRDRLARRLASPPTLADVMRTAVEAALRVLEPEPAPVPAAAAAAVEQGAGR